MKYIYESPDGGKTVYRRLMGQDKREPVPSDEPDVFIFEDGTIIIDDKGGNKSC